LREHAGTCISSTHYSTRESEVVDKAIMQGELSISNRAYVVLQAAQVVTRAESIREVLQHVIDGMAEETFRDAGVNEGDSGPTAFDKVLRMLRNER
jgi:hypothetical protein